MSRVSRFFDLGCIALLLFKKDRLAVEYFQDLSSQLHLHNK